MRDTAFEACICVNGRPVKEVAHNGTTYVEGRMGADYTLLFTNHSFERVLVIPSVDGLSVADGKPASRRSAGFIIESHSHLEIPGWVVNRSSAAKFEFRPQDARTEKTYIEALESEGARVDKGNQGLIGFLVLGEHFTPTMQFKGIISQSDANTWKKSGFDLSNHLSSEDRQNDGLSRGITCSTEGVARQQMNVTQLPAPTLGTGFGEETGFSTTTTGQFNRGEVRTMMMFEYDTLRGLKDRGVPVDLFKGKSSKGYSRVARSAFPVDKELGCKHPSGWNDTQWPARPKNR